MRIRRYFPVFAENAVFLSFLSEKGLDVFIKVVQTVINSIKNYMLRLGKLHYGTDYYRLFHIIHN